MPPPASRSSKTAPTGSGAGRRCSKSGGGGLVSTADDYLAFASALLAGGTHHGERVLSRPSVTLMTSDQLTPAQKAVSGFWPGYFDAMGWGFGMSVRTRRTHLGPSVGSYGWPGFYGTAWYNDPAEDLTTIFIMQRAHAGDQTLPMWHDFWTAVYQAIDDYCPRVHQLRASRGVFAELRECVDGDGMGDVIDRHGHQGKGNAKAFPLVKPLFLLVRRARCGGRGIRTPGDGVATAPTVFKTAAGRTSARGTSRAHDDRGRWQTLTIAGSS